MSDAEQGPTPTERVSLAADPESGRRALFEAEPKTVRVTLTAGEAVPAHQHPERDIVFHLRSGDLELRLGPDDHSLSAGDVVRFDGAQDIALRAVTDCDALLVLAPSAGSS